MSFISNYLYVVLIGIAAVIVVIVKVYRFSKLSKDQQYNSVKAWLLQAVLWAEGEFGSHTGKLKLSSVYAEFCKQLPWMAQIITFEQFSSWVDETLVDMRVLLDRNDAIADYIITKEGAK